MGGQLCEFPPAKHIRNFWPPKRQKRISRLAVTHTAGRPGGARLIIKRGLERPRGSRGEFNRSAARRGAQAAKENLLGFLADPRARRRLSLAVPAVHAAAAACCSFAYCSASATRLRTSLNQVTLISPVL